MAVFKCKMCGGQLQISEGASVVECEYCGARQTVSTTEDEGLRNLFNRANTLRLKSEFDKAEQLYERIVQADPTQAEAYWGIILCRYGIEYVEDPTTFNRIPTCHRASFDSVAADEDYKSALQHADSLQCAVYKKEAAEIDRIQKEILALSQKEEPYDVFICYKETDEFGKRTQDSWDASQIYHQLTMEGLKVFYAAITLEDKLGSAYEPCIFAALNSAQVMLVIGTKPEYFNAVWVKNEWGRYLKLMQKDRNRLLIPCYRDMDPYDLPDEFAHLQAQDMAKIGFVNDIVRGIKKVVVREDVPAPMQEQAAAAAASPLEPLLKRVFIFLEDGDWASADEYCEKVLDIDPENAQAYLGKLMSGLHVGKEEELANYRINFEQATNCKKVMRYGDEALVSRLRGYLSAIDARNKRERLQQGYDNAVAAMEAAKGELAYRQAASLFAELEEPWLDSQALQERCLEMATACRNDGLLKNGVAEMDKETIPGYLAALTYLEQIPGWRDADAHIARCHERLEAMRSEIYHRAMELMAAEDTESCQKAILEFKSISGWRDADENQEACKKRLIELHKLAQLKAKERAEREAEKQAAERAAKRKHAGRLVAILLPIVAVILSFIILLTAVIIPAQKYKKAEKLLLEGNYGEAKAVFTEIEGYKDASLRVNEVNYAEAEAQLAAGQYSAAIHTFSALGEYEDAADRVNEAKYEWAESLLDSGIPGQAKAAAQLYGELGTYRDTQDKLNSALLAGGAQPGDIVYFGAYEQDADVGNGAEKIAWIVLYNTEESLFVVSRDVLACGPYNDENVEITWERSSLRNWLNHDFFDAAFTADEAERVLLSVNQNSNDRDTRDRVFLLSAVEASDYFEYANTGMKGRSAVNSAYAQTCGAGSWWWLREDSKAEFGRGAILPGVDTQSGEFDYSGFSVADSAGGVRPAMYISLGEQGEE